MEDEGQRDGCREPRGSPHPPSPGRGGAVGSRARGLRSRRDSARGLLRRLPGPRLTSSCSLSLSPASRRSLPLGFSSPPPGDVAGGCWGFSGAFSRPPSSIAAATAGPLRAHRPVSQMSSRAWPTAPLLLQSPPATGNAAATHPPPRPGRSSPRTSPSETARKLQFPASRAP